MLLVAGWLQYKAYWSTSISKPFAVLSLISFCYPDVSVKMAKLRSRVNPLNPKIKIWILNLLSLFISYRSSGETLIKYQANSSCVIMSVILMTTLFYKALILQGEICCRPPLGLKGLREPAKIGTVSSSRAKKWVLSVIDVPPFSCYIRFDRFEVIVRCWFSSLLRELSPQVLWFSPLRKTQLFKIQSPGGIGWTVNH